MVDSEIEKIRKKQRSFKEQQEIVNKAVRKPKEFLADLDEMESKMNEKLSQDITNREKKEINKGKKRIQKAKEATKELSGFSED